MHSIKPNYFVGMRLPWTLESEANWRSTHQFASRAVVWRRYSDGSPCPIIAHEMGCGGICWHHHYPCVDTFHLLLSFLSSEQLTAQYIICEVTDRWIFTEFLLIKFLGSPFCY